MPGQIRTNQTENTARIFFKVTHLIHFSANVPLSFLLNLLRPDPGRKKISLNFYFQRFLWFLHGAGRVKKIEKPEIFLFSGCIRYECLPEMGSTCKSSRPEVFCKNVFLEISQNSQENTCTRVFFSIKLQA